MKNKNSTCTLNLLAMVPASWRSRTKNYAPTPRRPSLRASLCKRVLALFLLLVVTACAPKEQPFDPATHTPALAKGFFTASDGEQLAAQRWLVKRPRAVVIAVHGFNDYSHAFEGPGKYFQTRGIATFAYDQRGFGKSPDRGIWAGEQNLTRDLADFTRVIAKKYPHTRIFLLGESMGGAVVMLTVGQEDLPVAGVVLSAPAVWGRGSMPVFYQAMLWASAHTLPGYKITGEGLKIQASNNIPMLRDLSRDPLVIKATRLDTIYGLVHMMGDAYEAPERVRTPNLLLYGFKDEVIPKRPIEDIQPRLGGKATHIYYDGGYHMLMRDLQAKDVLCDMADWMLRQKNPPKKR